LRNSRGAGFAHRLSTLRNHAVNELEINIQEALLPTVEGVAVLSDECFEWISGGARVGSGFGISDCKP
jgi:hypothetical protein